ncbi:MAG: tetratricopeptide repeat protein [Qingshengfaniella sp.]
MLHVLFLVLSLTVISPVRAIPVAAATVGGGNDAAGAFADVLAVGTAVRELEAQLRDRGDLATVVDLAPQLLERLPDHNRLRRLYALALAASGDSRGARAELDRAGGDEGRDWAGLAEAMIARQAGDLEGAQAAVDQVLVQAPENAYAHNLDGTLKARTGDIAGAIQAFGRAVDLAPGAAAYQGNLGAMLLQAGAYAPALAVLDQAVALAPDNCATLVMRATALTGLGAFARAVPDLETCLSRNPGDRAAAEALMSGYMTTRDFEAAASALRRHEAALPDAGRWQADLALQTGEGGAALQALAGLDPAAPGIMLRRAYGLALVGDRAGALVAARQAVTDAPGDPAAHRAALGLALIQGAEGPTPIDPGGSLLAALGASAAGDPETARTALAGATGFVPGFSVDGLDPAALIAPEALPEVGLGAVFAIAGYAIPARRYLDGREGALSAYLSGLAARMAGDPEVALADFARAVDQAPGFVAARLERAGLLMANGRAEEAREDYRTVVAETPLPAAVLRIGVLSEALEDPDAAQAAYEQLVSLTPDSPIALNQLAWFLVSHDRDLGRALDLAEQADRLQPGNASVNDTIGWIQYLNGDLEGAERRLRAAFDISAGQQAEIRYHLARVLHDRGDPAAAAALLTAVEARGPEGAALLEEITGMPEGD